MRESGMNPRLLLVEDDPTSRTFLLEGGRGLPADIDAAGTLQEALLLASRHRYDAWLIDARLPDGSGADLLARLRGMRAGPHPPALGHTASRLPDDLEALRTAGFDAAVSKPLPIGEWQAAIRRLLGLTDLPHWDDALALRALNGHASGMQALRGLFLMELPKQHLAVTGAVAAGDADAAREQLHRLKASCGFVGAARLRDIVDRLYATPHDADTLSAFGAETAALLEDAASSSAG